jgi:hypothetical protein
VEQARAAFDAPTRQVRFAGVETGVGMVGR